MSEFAGFGLSEGNDQDRRKPHRDEPRLRAVGSPLPVGLRDPSPLQPVPGDAQRYRSTPPPPEHALARSAPAHQPPSGLQRAAGALRAALPFVQRILPLLDGNIGTAVSNVLAPYPQMPPPPPPVDLEPIEDSLSELQMQHRALRNQFLEQKTALKRVEDQLETVREAADRTAREQEEVLEGMQAVRKKVNRFAILASALLAVSLIMNVLLFLHVQHMIP